MVAIGAAAACRPRIMHPREVSRIVLGALRDAMGPADNHGANANGLWSNAGLNTNDLELARTMGRRVGADASITGAGNAAQSASLPTSGPVFGMELVR